MGGDRKQVREGGVMIDKGGVWWEVTAIPLAGIQCAASFTAPVIRAPAA